ncbi:Hypothetical protein Bdt_0393 [Bdellovibrio bacteriovorus str. Tiberius]|uniref:Uncharacterized protein n=1 Tax=Bdellovibrio bacteriovorus str. Tiberius TaxID=1069642 RepID=K7YK72_BDEBC|nr:Hypothetical protein Bdt_0393 [Bdellovibrio bacteriovorus str. Tiberius]
MVEVDFTVVDERGCEPLEFEVLELELDLPPPPLFPPVEGMVGDVEPRPVSLLSSSPNKFSGNVDVLPAAHTC